MSLIVVGQSTVIIRSRFPNNSIILSLYRFVRLARSKMCATLHNFSCQRISNASVLMSVTFVISFWFFRSFSTKRCRNTRFARIFPKILVPLFSSLLWNTSFKLLRWCEMTLTHFLGCARFWPFFSACSRFWHLSCFSFLGIKFFISDMHTLHKLHYASIFSFLSFSAYCIQP